TPSDPSTDTRRRRTKGTSRKVTEARATAQRAKLDAQTQVRQRKTELAQKEGKARPSQGKQDQHDLLAQRRANTSIRHAIDDYVLDHVGGNRSDKTLEWHRTALGLMLSFFEEERSITLVGEIDAPDITAWFAHLRTSPGKRGKPRAERTIQTYARSARASFHWLVRQETITTNHLDKVTFPKVG